MDAFGKGSRGYLHSWCRPCIAEDRRDRYARDPKHAKKLTYCSRAKRNKELWEKLRAFKQRPCADCGNTFPEVCMDFDHRDPSKKLEAISRMVHRAVSWERLEAELAKCDLVCSNCHRIRTWIGGRRKRA